MKIDKQSILSLLHTVKDPEIPTISLIDLGVITDITIEGDKVTVNMTPTFSGCPAMTYMVAEVKETLKNNGITDYEVNLSFDQPWNSNRITEAGRKALKQHGLAPPPQYIVPDDLNILQYATCPLCDSEDTELRNSFGPTLCRSMYFCNSCKQMFEAFKAV